MSKSKPSEHHVIPKSRGGRRTCSIPDNFHEAWHLLFENMTPKEICKFVDLLQQHMYNRREMTWEDINRVRNQIKGV